MKTPEEIAREAVRQMQRHSADKQTQDLPERIAKLLDNVTLDAASVVGDTELVGEAIQRYHEEVVRPSIMQLCCDLFVLQAEYQARPDHNG